MKNLNSPARYTYICICIIGAAAVFAAIVFVEAAVFYPAALVSYWKFDDAAGAVALDSVDANHGALVNEPSWTPGQVACALSFDGVNDYVQVPDSENLDITGPEITIEAWVYPNSVADENIILKKGVGGCDNYNLFVRGGTLALLSFDSCDWANAGQNALVSPGVWQHIAVTYDGSSIRYYINGTLKDTVAQAGLGALNNDALTIGGPAIEAWPLSRHFDGIIDEAALHTRVLPSAEIQQHYKDGLARLPYYPQEYSFDGLRSMVECMDTRRGIKEGLMKRIDAAASRFEKKLYDQTVNILDSLINEAEALNGRGVTQEQAEDIAAYTKGLQQLFS